MRLNEWIVDSNDIDILVLNGITEDDTTNTTEAIDSDLDWSHVAANSQYVVDSQALDVSTMSRLKLDMLFARRWQQSQQNIIASGIDSRWRQHLLCSDSLKHHAIRHYTSCEGQV
jgi:hypothetical protein